MCYSAQIWADFKKYRRVGGELDIKEFMKLAGWTKQKSTWSKVLPKALRHALADPSEVPAEMVELAHAAEAEAVGQIVEEICMQQIRLTEANAKLASPKPTKKAENDKRVATNKIAAGQRNLESMASPPSTDGTDRIWPGHFAPILICNPDTGERTVVPMRYRCRLPGWTEADEIEKLGTYNARRDKLTTVWRRVFGYHHGVVVVDKFFESVHLHDLQQRPLVPGEREQNVEIKFTPTTGEELFVACLWTYVESDGDDPGFYTFAIITDDPPAEVSAAGHDRCIVPIREQDIGAWLDPDPKNLQAMQDIIDDRPRPYYEHELAS